ncbi:Transcription elongation factor spt6, partial [Coemansia nantahalensis]
RHHAEHEGGEQEDLDALDDEDLALVAENTYGAVQETQPKGGRLKRLKRGRSRRAAGDEDGDDDDLGAELDDSRGARDDDLGLFGNEDDRDGRGGRRGGNDMDTRGYDDDIVDDDVPRAAPAAAGRGRGAVASFLTEGLEAMDDETWMELQDIFGTGEEYAFAMEPPVSEREAAREKTLADVFEPAELEAKMMTQKDEDIRATDIPERMQMRATGAEFLRPLTEDEIEEETTWVVRQLHAWLTRRELHRAQDSAENSAGGAEASRGGGGSGGDSSWGAGGGGGDSSWGGADNSRDGGDNSWGAGGGGGDNTWGGGGGGDNTWGGADDDRGDTKVAIPKPAEEPVLFQYADFANERFLAAVL